MRVLYFDLDGTVVDRERGFVKPRLANGALERGIRRAGFDRLVCVGNAVEIIGFLEGLGRDVDGHDMLLKLCQGAFEDEAWFRATTTWITAPRRRARDLKLDEDWYYVDDLAAKYMSLEGMDDPFARHRGGRICVPDAVGDGSDILSWLAGTCGEPRGRNR